MGISEHSLAIPQPSNLNVYKNNLETSGQDRGIGRQASPPHTTVGRITNRSQKQ